MLSKNAVGNLLSRYKAVLKKCHILNTFGSLAVAGMLVMGVSGTAGAAASVVNLTNTDTPNATMSAGDYESPADGATVKVSGFKGGNTSIHVDGLNNTGNTIINLTGQASGADAGILSDGSVTITMAENPNPVGGTGFDLHLGDGTNNATFNGNLTINGSTRTYTASNARLYTVGASEVTINGDLTLTKAASAIIAGDNGKLTVNNLNVGESGVSKATVDVGNWQTGVESHLVAENVVIGGYLDADNDKQTSIVRIGNGSLTTKTLELNDYATLQMHSPFAAGVYGEIDVTDGGITMGAETHIGLGQATLTADFLTLSDTGKVDISTNNTGLQASKIVLRNAASYSVDTFQAFTTGTGDDGKISMGKMGSFQVNNTLTLTGGGNLHMYVNDGGDKIASGTIAAYGLTLDAATTLTGGNVHLLDDGDAATTQQLKGSLTVNNTVADSTLNVSGGIWTADSRITIADGALVVSAGASLDAQTGLTIDTTGAATVSGILSANVADFGIVDLANKTFDDSGANVAVDLVGSVDTVLNLYASDTSGISISSADLDILEAAIAAEVFGAGFGGTVNIYGYGFGIPTLSGVTALHDEPTGTLGAGTLRFEGTTTLGGIVADSSGNTNSTIISQGEKATGAITLNLTGQGAANGVLSAGDIMTQFVADNTTTTGSGIILNLGSGEAASIKGSINLVGSNNSFGARQAVANVVGNTALTIDNDLSLSKGADFNIAQDAGSTASLTVKNIVIGDADSTQTTILAVGKGSGGVGTVDAKSISINGSQKVQNLNIWKGTVNTDTITFTGESTTNVGVSITEGAVGKLNVAGALNLTDKTIVTIGQGTVTAASLNMGAESKLIVGNNIAAKNPLFIVKGATTLAVNNFVGTATTSGENGKIAIGNTGIFQVDNTLTLTGGGALHLYGVNSAGTTHSYGGTIAAQGFDFTGATTLTAGNVQLLAGTGTQTFDGTFTVNHADSSMIVKGGTWEADSRLTVTDGKLVVNAGASLDVQTGLTIGTAGAGDVNGTLSANLADFGTVDMASKTFTDANAKVAVDLTGGAGTLLNLYVSGASGTSIAEADLDAIKTQVSNAVFGGAFAGEVQILGYDVIVSTLSGVQKEYNNPENTLGAGTLRFEGETTLGGIVANADGSTSSLIISRGESAQKPITLNLTGQGAANGVLSAGDIMTQFVADNTTTTGSGIVLNLGSGEAASIKGSINLVGSNNSFGARQAVANVVGNTALTIDNDLSLSKGADFYIAQDAGSTASLTVKNIVIGDADSTQSTILAVGKSSGGVGTVNAESISIDGSQKVQNINIWKGTISTNTITFTGESTTNVGVSTMEGAVGKLNVAGALDLTDKATISVGQGTVTAASLNVGDESKLIIGNNIAAKNPLFIVKGATTLAVNDFVGTATTSGESGKIAIGNTGIFQVDNTLTLTGGGALHLHGVNSAGTTHSYGGTIAAQGFDFTGATTLTAGNVQLLAGTGTQTFSGTFTVNHADSSMTVKGGTWTNTGAITVDAGSLTIEAGTLTAGATIDTTGGKLNLNTGATLAMGSHDLSVNLVDFAAVDFTTGTFDLSGSSVNGTLTSDNDVTLELVAAQAGMLYADEIAALKTALAAKYTGIDSFTLDNINEHMSLGGLSDANDGDIVVGAGTYTSPTHSIINGIVANGRTSQVVDSTINAKGGTLSITGNTGAERVLSVGSFTVNQGALNLGYDGTAKTDGGAIKGDLIVDETANMIATVDIYGTNVTVTGKTEVKNGGALTVNEGSTFTSTGGISVDGAGSMFTAGDNVDVSSLALTGGGSVHIATDKTVKVDTSMALQGGDMNVGSGTLQAAGFTNTTADLKVTDGTISTTAGMTTNKNLTIADGAGFDLAGGNMDVSGVTFTTETGSTLSSAVGTTLTVGLAAIGVNVDGTVSTTEGTVHNDTNVDGRLGSVTIKGLTITEIEYGGADSTYGKLLAAAHDSFGTNFNSTTTLLKFEGLTVKTDDATLDQVSDNDDTSLGNNTVKAGTVGANHTVTVGGIADADTTTGISATNAGKATFTGNNDTKQIAPGDVKTTGTGETTLGNSDNESTLGGKLVAEDTAKVTATNVNIKEGSENTGAGDVTLKESTVGTEAAKAESLTQTGSGSTKLEKSTVHVKNLIGDDDGDVFIGSSSDTLPSTASADLVNLDADGDGDVATVVIDPAWQTDASGAVLQYQDSNTASAAALLAFDGGAVNGNLLVGQNAQLVLGSADTTLLAKDIAALEALDNANKLWGSAGITAAVGIYAPQTLASTGSIYVNGAATTWNGTTKTWSSDSAALHTVGGNNAIFADKSMLLVSVAGLGGKAALTSTGGTLVVADSSTLVIADGEIGDTVTVATGFTGGDSKVEGWGVGETSTGLGQYATLMTDDRSIGIATPDFTGGVFTAELVAAKIELPGVDPTINAFLTDASGERANMPAGSSRLAFVNYVLSTATSEANAAQVAESAPQIAAAGGVAHGAMKAVQAGNDATTARVLTRTLTGSAQSPTSVAMDDGQVGLNAGNAMKNGVGVWLMPLYKWTSTHGLESNGFDSGYNSGLGGIALGVDYTMHESIRVGLAFNVGAGYSSSTGGLSETNTNFDFWGLSLYAGYQKDNFGLAFDVGYSGSYNDVTQDTPIGSGLGSYEADVEASVWTVGLNAEYTIETEVLDITPHVGVRYMGVTTHGHNVEGTAGTVFDVDSSYQGVWYFPVGVTFSSDVGMDNGWTFTPKLDLGFVAAAGELDAKTSASMPGVSTGVETEMQTVDGFAFNGGLGFEIGNENVSFGLNYNLQASEHETGHMVFGTFRYEF